MWYLLAILALLIFGPRLARAAWDSAADWRRAGGAAWDGLRKLYGYGNNNFALGLAVGLLVGVAGVWGAGHLPSIKWPEDKPPVVVPVDGPRRILIAYESTNAPALFKGTLVSLRSGANEAALKAKGHTLDIIDLDEKDKDGNPSKAAKDYRAAYPSLQVPVIILRDQAGKVLHSEPLATSATAAQVLAIVEGKR